MASLAELRAKQAANQPGTQENKREETPVHTGQKKAEAQAKLAKPEPKVYLYSTPNAPFMTMHLGNKTVQAKDGVLKLNEFQHEELQELIASGRPDIAANVRLLDPEAAEKIALDYLERHKPVAGKGGLHSGLGAERTKQDFIKLPDTGADPEYRAQASIDATPEQMMARARKLQDEKKGTLNVTEGEFAHPEDVTIPDKLIPNK